MKYYLVFLTRRKLLLICTQHSCILMLNTWIVMWRATFFPLFYFPHHRPSAYLCSVPSAGAVPEPPIFLTTTPLKTIWLYCMKNSCKLKYSHFSSKKVEANSANLEANQKYKIKEPCSAIEISTGFSHNFVLTRIRSIYETVGLQQTLIRDGISPNVQRLLGKE